MKKIEYLLMSLFIFCIGMFGAKADKIPTSYTPDEVPIRTYIIGKHMFSRVQHDGYNGTLTTQLIMVAAQSIEGDEADNMIIYYKDPHGKWINAINDNPIDFSNDWHFTIDYYDTLNISDKDVVNITFKNTGKVLVDVNDLVPFADIDTSYIEPEVPLSGSYNRSNYVVSVTPKSAGMVNLNFKQYYIDAYDDDNLLANVSFSLVFNDNGEFVSEGDSNQFKVFYYDTYYLYDFYPVVCNITRNDSLNVHNFEVDCQPDMDIVLSYPSMFWNDSFSGTNYSTNQHPETTYVDLTKIPSIDEQHVAIGTNNNGEHRLCIFDNKKYCIEYDSNPEVLMSKVQNAIKKLFNSYSHCELLDFDENGENDTVYCYFDNYKLLLDSEHKYAGSVTYTLRENENAPGVDYTCSIEYNGVTNCVSRDISLGD